MEEKKARKLMPYEYSEDRKKAYEELTEQGLLLKWM